MPDKSNYWTQQRSDAKWESKREGATRASKVADTHADAWTFSREKAAQTNGKAFLKGRDGITRERDTYGADPYPPKG